MLKINNSLINPSFIISGDLNYEVIGIAKTGRVRLIIYVAMGQSTDIHKSEWFDSEKEALIWYQGEIMKDLFEVEVG